MKKNLAKTFQTGKSGTKIVVDSSCLCYAAFYSYGHLSYDGKPTGVIYGFLRRVLDIAEKYNTNKFFFCFDSPWTYREQDYKGYKCKRHTKSTKKTEEEEYQHKVEQASIHLQREVLMTSVLPSMGFRNIYLRKGFEADDLLAIWVRKLCTQCKVVMVTTDMDMCQCLDCCIIYNPRKKEELRNLDFQKEYCIRPDKWALAKAIGGCNSDDVIGIKGVSDPKNKSSLALKYLSGKLKKGKIFDKIESKEGQKIINKNLPIVTTPYKESKLTRMIMRRDCFTSMKFIKTFEDLGFNSFTKPKILNKWKGLFL